METGAAARSQKTSDYKSYSLITFLKLSKILTNAEVIIDRTDSHLHTSHRTSNERWQDENFCGCTDEEDDTR